MIISKKRKRKPSTSTVLRDASYRRVEGDKAIFICDKVVRSSEYLDCENTSMKECMARVRLQILQISMNFSYVIIFRITYFYASILCF